jgi:para-nitrobenzyl esterase
MNLVNNMGKAENLPGYLESVALQHPGKEAQSNQIWTDFFHSAVASASRRAELRNTDVWVYRFDLPSSRNPFGALLELAGVGNDLGATHAAEIELTFNYFDLPDDRNMFYEKDDATAAELAEKWSTTILNFAHSGEPNGAGLPNWPKFGGPERMALVVDAQSSIVSAPHAALYATLYGDVVSTQQQ